MTRCRLSLVSSMLIYCALAIQGQAATRYVDISNSTPLAPYTSWATAATSIQPAVDASSPGDTVLVADGTYVLAAEISVNKSITIESVNGRLATAVDGDYTVRCFNLGGAACVISGFTIQHGFAEYGNGGGILCSSSTPVVTNCTINGNEAFYGDGGGMYQGTANGCTISQNGADLGGGMYGGIANDCTIDGNSGYFNGGGLMDTTANRCTIRGNSSVVGGGMLGGTANSSTISNNTATSYGGGMYDVIANHCVIRGNTAEVYGGGTYYGTANNCVIRDNFSYTNGGGMYQSTAINCTVTGNSADNAGGGTFDSAVRNSIVWYNSANDGKDMIVDPESPIGSTDNTCSPDVTHNASGNITNPPAFLDRTHGDYQLLPGSPCIDAGANWAVTVSTDFEGNPRINDGTVDMGAYEFYPQNHDHYVALKGSHTSPFDSWEKAATNIQTAVLLTPDGFTVHVTNGVYHLSSEIAVSSDIVIQSVHGPAVTAIDGGGIDRCFNLGGQACIVSGFTVSNGYTTGHGGGVFCSDAVPVVTNCTIRGNAASVGGGLYNGTARTCVIRDNTATSFGGGLYNSTANHCTISDNAADAQGGGMYGGTAANSIVWYNAAPSNGNMYGGTAVYTCSPDLPHGAGGNITNAPMLLSPPYLVTNSPCMGAGSIVYAGGTDFFGTPWLNPPSMGAYEYAGPGSVTGNIGISFSTPPAVFAGYGATYEVIIDGASTWLTIDFGDGTVLTNPYGPLHHSYPSTGSFDVVISAYNDDFPGGMSTTQAIAVAEDVLYVSDATGDDTNSGYTLGEAKRTIQGAHDVALDGVTIRVESGTYRLSEEIVVSKNVTIESISGPDATVIQGRSIEGSNTVRCLNLGSSACIISGFTITSGHVRPTGDGGGVLCSSLIPVVTNCVIIGNSAKDGGGMYGGTANNCTISENFIDQDGGGMAYGVANDCLIRSNFTYFLTSGEGGGMAYGTANRCIITGNFSGYGGGMANSTANNCTVVGNLALSGGSGLFNSTANNCTIRENGMASSGGFFGGGFSSGNGGGLHGGAANNCLITENAADEGGGMYDGTAINCTITSNTASYQGGGVTYGTAYNCVIWYNTSDPRVENPDVDGGLLEYSASPGVTHGEFGNTADPPLFEDVANENYRLKWYSPLRNAGTNAYVVGSTDLDGNPRIQEGVVNMGAYEDADTDSDGLTDASEIRYGSNPGVKDSDGDGYEDGYEVAHGLSPAQNNTAFLTAYVHSNAADYGYFDSAAVLDLGIGDIGMQITNGLAELSVQIWESDDLATWTNTTPVLEWSVPVDDDKRFFRVRAEP